MMINLYHWFEWKNNEAQKEWNSKNILTREDSAECKSCGGRGWNYLGFKVLGDCEVCDGTGFVKVENNKPHYKYNWKLNKAELVR